MLSEITESALKISACRYLGTVPGAEGNLVITGHDYRSGAIFGRLNKMEEGDDVLLTGKDGKTYAYVVYAIEHIKPDETERLCETEYGCELSLLTCENSGNGRLLVRCRLAAKRGHEAYDNHAREALYVGNSYGPAEQAHQHER